MDPEPKDYFCVSWNADLAHAALGYSIQLETHL